TKIERRNERGLFHGISSSFEWIIGTPDVDDAQYYSNAIKALDIKNRETQLHIKNQVQIMPSAIINYNSSLQSLKVNESRLNENINTFNDFPEKIIKAMKGIIIEDVVTDHFDI
ncbi:hypothetical protein HHI36_001198, partial [Cryptolaemus montrouzieri]